MRICLTIICAVLFLSCEDEKEDKRFVPYKGAIEEADNIQVLYSEAAVLKVKLETAKQLKYQSEDKIFPKPITIHFYDLVGNETAILQSDSGRYDSKANVYKVIGHVSVRQRATQRNLFTSELTWDPVGQKTFTEKPVTVEVVPTGELIKGVGLDANRDFSKMIIRKTSGFFNAPSGIAN